MSHAYSATYADRSSQVEEQEQQLREKWQQVDRLRQSNEQEQHALEVALRLRRVEEPFLESQAEARLAHFQRVVPVARELVHVGFEDIDAISSGPFEAGRLCRLLLAPEGETYDTISDLLQWTEAFTTFTQVIAKFWGEKLPALISAMLDYQSFMLRLGRLVDSATVLDFVMHKMDRNMSLADRINPKCWMVTMKQFKDFCYTPGRVKNQLPAVAPNGNRPSPRKRRPQRASNESRRRRKDRKL